MKDKIIDEAIRRVPDFPKKGILFYDITGILVNPKVFSYCLDKMTEMYKDEKIDAIAAIEARGFIFAAPLAYKMGIPLILIRKKENSPEKHTLPHMTLSMDRPLLKFIKPMW